MADGVWRLLHQVFVEVFGWHYSPRWKDVDELLLISARCVYFHEKISCFFAEVGYLLKGNLLQGRCRCQVVLPVMLLIYPYVLVSAALLL